MLTCSNRNATFIMRCLLLYLTLIRLSTLSTPKIGVNSSIASKRKLYKRELSYNKDWMPHHQIRKSYRNNDEELFKNIPFNYRRTDIDDTERLPNRMGEIVQERKKNLFEPNDESSIEGTLLEKAIGPVYPYPISDRETRIDKPRQPKLDDFSRNVNRNAQLWKRYKESSYPEADVKFNDMEADDIAKQSINSGRMNQENQVDYHYDAVQKVNPPEYFKPVPINRLSSNDGQQEAPLKYMNERKSAQMDSDINRQEREQEDTLPVPNEAPNYYDPNEVEESAESSFNFKNSKLTPLVKSYAKLIQPFNVGAEDRNRMLPSNYIAANSRSANRKNLQGKRWKREYVETDIPYQNLSRILHRQKRHEFSTNGSPTSTPDDYFCPKDPKYLSNKSEVLYSAKDKTAMFWNGAGLVFSASQIGEEKQCLILDVIGDGFAQIFGWRIKGLRLPKELREKYHIKGGMIKTYVVKYETVKNEWIYIMDGDLPKIFVNEGDLENPDIESTETLSQPLSIAEIQFCPVSSEGETPIMYVDLFGCRLYPKDEFALLYFDEKYEEPYTCMNSLSWIGEGLIFETNAGRNSEAASFSSGGFSFSLLPDTIPGAPNSEYYLEAHLSQPFILFRIKVAGSVFGMAKGMISEFTIGYLDVTNTWRMVANEDGKTKVFDIGREHAPTASTSNVVLSFPHPLSAKSIRIFPQSWWGHGKTLRMDLQGCDIFPIHDRSQECRVPYNLISRSIIIDKTLETFLTDESAVIDDPNGFDFNLQKNQKWKNKDAFIRAAFPEPTTRKITSLILRGGHTSDGRMGIVNDVKLRYGSILANAYDEINGTWISLSIASATAVVESENPEDSRYIFMFNPPLDVRVLDLFPQNWKHNCILRFALRGCHTGGHPYSFCYYNPELLENKEKQTTNILRKKSNQDFSANIKQYFERKPDSDSMVTPKASEPKNPQRREIEKLVNFLKNKLLGQRLYGNSE